MSINIDSNVLQNLAGLGLSDKEALVYVALLKGGDMGAIGVSKVVELHRQFVYTSLQSLKEKGLVLQVGVNPSRWRAQTPRKLIAIAEELQNKAEVAARQLIALQEDKAGQEFEITEGIKAFRNRLLEPLRTLPENSTVFMVTGQWEKYFERAGKELNAEWDRIRLLKSIRFRMVGPESLRISMDEAAATRGLSEFRVIPGLKDNLVNTIVYGDLVVFEIYGTPHITLSVRNPDIAISQIQYFETLWNLGKE
jgi:sugar-specific transcriptional regulator TrmB